MLRGSPSRRVAAVLLTVLVAALLVPFAGASRPAPHRTAVGTAAAASTTHATRVAHVTPGNHHEHLQQLDASTPPDDASVVPARVTHLATADATPWPDHDQAAPTGRGPPAL